MANKVQIRYTMMNLKDKNIFHLLEDFEGDLAFFKPQQTPAFGMRLNGEKFVSSG